MTPSIGRSVHAYVDPTTNNGVDYAAATITRVWGPFTAGDGWTVNLKIFLDGNETLWRTSVYLYPDRATAEAYSAAEQPLGRAWWPERVG